MEIKILSIILVSMYLLAGVILSEAKQSRTIHSEIIDNNHVIILDPNFPSWDQHENSSWG